MKTSSKILIIAAMVIVTTILHYITNPMSGPIHDIYQRFYYVPVILAGLWFGVKGGLITAFTITVIYFPHLYHGWQGPHTFYYRLSEAGMYHVIGALTGYLAAQAQTALHRERKSRADKESAYNDLKKKTEELFTLEEQLRRSDRLAALGRLSAGLAHEIRNPLGSIKTAVEILRDRHSVHAAQTDSAAARAEEEELPDLYEILLEETERLDRILNNFLRFARSEEQREEGEPSTCRIADTLSKTADLLEGQLRKKNIQLVFDPDELNCAVKICSSHLSQIFVNLILNSMDAIEADGIIRVGEVARDNSHLTFVFEDNGPGIPPEIADKAFDPFFSTREAGTGLGLSIVERIINSHDGRISLEKSDRPTSRFLISFLAV